MSETEASLFETALKYLLGGTLGILTLPKGFKFIASSGSGAYIYDTEGRRYLDYLMGSGSVILGHAHPSVTEATMIQLRRGTNFYVENDKAVELAKVVVSAVPCAEKVRFVSSGSEANLYAMRLARSFTGRDKILRFEGSYHGFSDYAMLSSQFADSKTVRQFPEVSIDSAGIPEAVAKTMVAAPFNDLDTTTRIVNENEKDLAAVIVEPLQRTVAPKPGFLQGLRELTANKDMLLIFDEIVTGFRLAYGGAQEYYGVVPDIACVGKTFAGGFPIGAVCGRADIMDALNPQGGYYGSALGKRVSMTGTFNGNPISCAAGLATLRELRSIGAYEKLNSYGDKLRKMMGDVFDRHDVTAQVHGDGAVTGFTFTDREVVDFRSEATGDAILRDKVIHGLLERSIFAPYKLYNSLAHSEAELNATIEALDDVVKSLKGEGAVP